MRIIVSTTDFNARVFFKSQPNTSLWKKKHLPVIKAVPYNGVRPLRILMVEKHKQKFRNDDHDRRSSCSSER